MTRHRSRVEPKHRLLDMALNTYLRLAQSQFSAGGCHLITHEIQFHEQVDRRAIQWRECLFPSLLLSCRPGGHTSAGRHRDEGEMRQEQGDHPVGFFTLRFRPGVKTPLPLSLSIPLSRTVSIDTKALQALKVSLDRNGLGNSDISDDISSTHCFK